MAETYYFPPVVLGFAGPHVQRHLDQLGVPRSPLFRRFYMNYVDAGMVVEGFDFVGGRWNGPLTQAQIDAIVAAGQPTRIITVDSIYDLPMDLEGDYGPPVPPVGVIAQVAPMATQELVAATNVAGPIAQTAPMATQVMTGEFITPDGHIFQTAPMATQVMTAETAEPASGTITQTAPMATQAMTAVATVDLHGSVWGSEDIDWGDPNYNWRGDHV